MTIQSRKYNYLIASIGSIFSGLFVYTVLSYLLISPRITVPFSIAISGLVLGLTIYYSTLPAHSRRTENSERVLTDIEQYEFEAQDNQHNGGRLSNFLFILIFTTLIIISSLTYSQNSHVFVNWNQISVIEFIQLGSAISLCFFVPGYGISLIINKRYLMNPLVKILIGYLFSMMVTGLVGYISALVFDVAISESKFLFIGVYVAILIAIIISTLQLRTISLPIKRNVNHYHRHITQIISKELWSFIQKRISQLLVFGSLLVIILVSTYVTFGGVTIGDQWYHQGRALSFISGTFRHEVITEADVFYPPFQSVLLASLTTLSGIPLVNAYASIAFVNIMPMFSFYYFYKRWVPVRQQKSVLLASTLFVLSAGFGWIFILVNLPQPIISEESSLEALRTIGHLDIVSASNFVIATAPDFSTGLLYIALPAGFVLLGVIRTGSRRKIVNTAIITSITVLGIMSHYEFYFFIIIASLLPFLFKLKGMSNLYLGLLGAILIIYLMNNVTPGDFFTSLRILGYPLLYLAGVFVFACWAVYLISGYIHSTLWTKLPSLKTMKNIVHSNKKIKFATTISLIFLTSYLYLLGFIVLSQLSLDVTRDHTSQGTVPWYLYPMKLGVVGLFGISYGLSYLIRRFEKEIFIFGLIIIISIVTGPYYDESRFTKYTMIGMIGFASLMIYKILIWGPDKKIVRITSVVSIIIVTSCLSMLVFAGYNSLIFQTQEYSDTLARRHFPSSAELQLLDTLRGIVHTNSERYNVISFANEYDNWNDGFMSKISSFTGIPLNKLFQSPYVLNATTLDSFYHQLENTNARYILLPKSSIKYVPDLFTPTQFATEHFRHVYEDNENIILEVPSIKAPNSDSKTRAALVYKEANHLQENKTNLQVLHYDNKTFNFKIKDQNLPLAKINETQGIVIYGSKSGVQNTLWSKQLSPKIKANSFESGFRILPQYGNKSTSSDLNLKWRQGNVDYYTKLSENGLELFQKPSPAKQFEILKNIKVEIKYWVPYRLKIESINNSVSIYVNDIPKIQIHDPLYENKEQWIARIGLSSNNYDVEFNPIIIWNESQTGNLDKNHEFDYQYPLSILALSRTNYDIYRDNDWSVFSNEVILVPDNLTLDNTTFSEYMKYVQSGGRLITINSDGHFNETFSNLFSIKSIGYKLRPFTSITSDDNQNLTANVHGMTRAMQIKSNSDGKILASYHEKDSPFPLAPFALEKKFGNGSIILVNAEGYFNTIKNSPRNYFQSPSNTTRLLIIDLKNTSTGPTITALPMKSFTGDLEALGEITLSTRSLSIAKNIYPYSLDVERISVVNTENHSQMNLNSVSVKDLKVIGDMDITINLNGALKLPDMISGHNYIGVSVPTKFNVTIHLLEGDKSKIKIIGHNGEVTEIAGNGSIINLYNVHAQSPIGFVSLLLKEPELTVEGRTLIKEPYFSGYFDYVGRLSPGSPIDFEGKLNMKFKFVDDYNRPFATATSTGFISYLQSVTMKGSNAKPVSSLKIPGDISEYATIKGEHVDLKRILISPSNIVAILVLMIGTVLSIWLIKKNYLGMPKNR